MRGKAESIGSAGITGAVQGVNQQMLTTCGSVYVVGTVIWRLMYCTDVPPYALYCVGYNVQHYLCTVQLCYTPRAITAVRCCSLRRNSMALSDVVGPLGPAPLWLVRATRGDGQPDAHSTEYTTHTVHYSRRGRVAAQPARNLPLISLRLGLSLTLTSHLLLFLLLLLLPSTTTPSRCESPHNSHRHPHLRLM